MIRSGIVIRTLALLCAVCIAVASWLGINYARHDEEVVTLDDKARGSATGSFLKTSDGYTHYEMAGSPDAKRIVVFVHGFSVPYYLWDGTFQAVAQQGFRVLRYDLFGRGFSDRPDVKYDAALYDRQLSELLTSLGMSSPVDLVASSMGGPIAAGYACNHPDRVRTLTLFDPGYSHGQEMPAKLGEPFWGEYRMAVEIAPHLAESQLTDFAHPERFPNWPAQYRPQMKYKGFRTSLLSTLRYYLKDDWSSLYSCVGKSSTPVFLVWGKKDLDVPFSTSREVLAAVPRAEFLPVDDSAHVPFLEHPEIVHPALIDFLRRH